MLLPLSFKVLHKIFVALFTFIVWLLQYKQYHDGFLVSYQINHCTIPNTHKDREGYCATGMAIIQHGNANDITVTKSNQCSLHPHPQ